MAVRNGKLASVKQLVAAGADLNAATVTGATALILAQKYRMAQVEAYLTELSGAA